MSIYAFVVSRKISKIGAAPEVKIQLKIHCVSYAFYRPLNLLLSTLCVRACVCLLFVERRLTFTELIKPRVRCACNGIENT